MSSPHRLVMTDTVEHPGKSPGARPQLFVQKADYNAEGVMPGPTTGTRLALYKPHG